MNKYILDTVSEKMSVAMTTTGSRFSVAPLDESLDLESTSPTTLFVGRPKDYLDQN